MADEPPSENYLGRLGGGFAEGFRSGLKPEQIEMLTRSIRRAGFGPRPSDLEATVHGTPQQAEDLKPAVAGGGREPKRQPRGRRGKVTNVAGHRVVNYYEFTKHELDSIGTKRREATESFAIAAFALGIALDTVKDFVLSTPASDVAKGVWGTALVVAILASAYYFWLGFRRHSSAKTMLQEIKDDHDFD